MSKLKPIGRPGWTRRQALGLAGGAASLALLSSRGVSAKASQLVVATGGGKLENAYKKSIFTPFTEKTDIEIVTTSNPLAKLKAMVEQGQVEWDVVQAPPEQLLLLGREGMLEPIDYSIVDKTHLIAGAAREDLVLTDVAAYHVAWNTENVTSNPPQNWAEMWAYDGRIGLWKRPYQTLEAALLADGVAMDELYPLDVERGLKSLGKIRDKLVWWERGAQGAQLLLDGEVDVGAIWNGRVHQPKLDGAPVDFTFDQAVFVNDAWAVPKGAPNAKEAMELINFCLSPKAQADYSREIPYGPVNKEAFALLDDRTKEALPSSPQNYDKGILLDLDYWVDNGQKVSERFNEWLLS